MIPQFVRMGTHLIGLSKQVVPSWWVPIPLLGQAINTPGYFPSTTTIMKVPGLGLGRAPVAAGSISAAGM